MVTFTSNKGLGLPAVGGDTGAWGPPLNNNSSVLDASLGGSVTIPISSVAGALTLLASNYNNVFISFNGAITQNTVITLPAIGSFYVMQNITTGTSQFTVTLATTAAGSQQVGVPPYQAQDVFTDGSNVRFRGLPHIGTYWDYSGSSVPGWVAACTVPPWLNCDGTAFSSATYPYLATILGGTTLPDSRGRVRAPLNQTTSRLLSSNGVDGNTFLAGGGLQTTTLSSLHLPQMVDPGHTHVFAVGTGTTTGNFVTRADNNGNNPYTSSAAFTGITYGSSAQIGTPVVQPTYISGLTLIRAG